MQSALVTFNREYKEKTEKQLQQIVSELRAPGILKEAMQYSLNAGGKRIRPMLLYATAEAFGRDPNPFIPLGCAIEMLHTYSLIHDDLPCMDNDDFRRGKPTNHIVFGEDIATLAGDALLTQSFGVISQLDSAYVSDSMKVELIREFTAATGAEGMVGGQVLDMQGEGKELSLDELKDIHNNKTGELLAFSVGAGAIVCGASEAQKRALKEFSLLMGLAFQIQDDILDVIGDEATIGKPVGSDEENDKSTYVRMKGLDGAKVLLEETVQEALHILDELQLQDTLLRELCLYIQNRVA